LPIEELRVRGKARVKEKEKARERTTIPEVPALTLGLLGSLVLLPDPEDLSLRPHVDSILLEHVTMARTAIGCMMRLPRPQRPMTPRRNPLILLLSSQRKRRRKRKPRSHQLSRRRRRPILVILIRHPHDQRILLMI
jgi:hypothetical protein